MERPHLLILDEPTNHLDIDSRRALTEALNDYEGAVILITHDRSLMELVADRLWLVDRHTVKPFDGDMDDYARKILERARNSGRAPAKRIPTSLLRTRLSEAEAALAKRSGDTGPRAAARLARAEAEWLAAAEALEQATSAR